MPAIGVQHCLRHFEQSVQDSLIFLQEAQNFKIIQTAGSYRHIGVRRIESIAGLALLKIHLAWEEFLESVFVRYMCGATSASGFAPTLLSSPVSTISGAMKKLLQSNRYLNWNPQDTLHRANCYYDHGEPFATTISAVMQTGDDIVTVRNRFAHRSEYAAQRFRALVLKAFGYVPRGMSPGRFLLITSPSSYSWRAKFLRVLCKYLAWCKSINSAPKEALSILIGVAFYRNYMSDAVDKR